MNMDADTWNAYHLMSNRARAVCYAARSIQFRALTELTVNKLMDTAHTQIQTLSSLKVSYTYIYFFFNKYTIVFCFNYDFIDYIK